MLIEFLAWFIGVLVMLVVLACFSVVLGIILLTAIIFSGKLIDVFRR